MKRRLTLALSGFMIAKSTKIKPKSIKIYKPKPVHKFQHGSE